MPHPALATGKTAVLAAESKSIPASAVRQHLALQSRVCNSQLRRKAELEIVVFISGCCFRSSDRRKFGRICQCLSCIRCCVTRRLTSKQIRPGDAEAQIG